MLCPTRQAKNEIMYHIIPDEFGFSIVYRGYALYRGLSYDAASTLVERFMSYGNCNIRDTGLCDRLRCVS